MRVSSAIAFMAVAAFFAMITIFEVKSVTREFCVRQALAQDVHVMPYCRASR